MFGAVALLASTFYFLRNFNSFSSSKLRAYAASDLAIYNDQLASGFSDWSWSSDRNFQATDQVKDGTSSISFTPQAWGALYLHTDTQIDANQYDSLTFSVRGSADNQKLSVMLYDNNNQMIGSPRSLSDFGGNIENNNWKTYTIPLSTIDPSNSPIKGIGLQETAGQTQPAIHIDDITLIAKAIPTPTPTNGQTSPTAGATSASVPTDAATMYTDSLGSNFENWSWNSDINLDNSSPTYQGSKSISYQVNSGWGALYLHAKSPVDTTNYSHVTFAINATASDEKFSVAAMDTNGHTLSGVILLKDVGGAPTVGSWKVYSIPLNTLHAANITISGLIIQDQSGNSQPTIYVDEIRLTANPIAAAPVTASPSQTTTNIQQTTGTISNSQFFVDPNSNAKITADQWRAAGRTADADQMMKIANSPTAVWLTGGDPTTKVNDYVSKAAAANAMPVMVTYNIPGRDCGQYSSGGTTYTAYQTWIGQIANAIGTRKATIILEPDALGLGCLQNDTTYSLLRSAVDTLTSHSSITVYVTASSWVDPATTATRLNAVDVSKAQGFALNISGFDTTPVMTQYGTSVSQKIGGKHFVIDTSRDGNGPYDPTQTDPWCNPPERALGIRPTTNTGNSLVDAYLWIKIPGESDGTCRGGPSAGSWWSDYALGLAKRANY